VFFTWSRSFLSARQRLQLDVDVCAISRPAGGPSLGRRLPKGFALSDADDYKRFIERCLKLAKKAKGVSEEKALLEIAWRFAQLAHRATIKRRAGKPKLH